jgi:hypothetical protein
MYIWVGDMKKEVYDIVMATMYEGRTRLKGGA